jgi:Na+/H+ antiporter NhaD/arsenite permease-like protein
MYREPIMSRTQILSLIIAGLVIGACGVCWAGHGAPRGKVVDGSKLGARLIVQGEVRDTAGNEIRNADIHLFLDGRPYRFHGDESAPALEGVCATGNLGLFRLETAGAPDEFTKGNWAVQIRKTSFKPSKLVHLAKINDEGVNDRGVRIFSATITVTLERYQGAAFWVALVILVGIYVLISLEIMHRTLAALLGAALVLAVTHTIGHFNPAYEVLNYEQALRAVDWNVIFLLMGMMIIVGVLKESGVFQWLAYKSFHLTGGRVFLLAATLCAVTAMLSAFLDNVTAMLLLTPVTIEIALILGISPLTLLMPEIMASNFGGTATLIGDPPNIMIGSYAGLTFNDFVMTLTPVVIITMVAQILYTRWYYGKEYQKGEVDDVPGTISFLREKYRITDSKLLITRGIVLLGVITLFIMHGFFHMEVSVAALLGASLILILSRQDIVRVLEHEVEWPSLVFFIMLFIVVGAAEETGILQVVADWLKDVCAGNITMAIILVMWTAALFSAIVDNIPFTATMLPIVAFLGKTVPGGETGVLWWALALGACFGGNATVIGASANVITTGIAEKSGYRISFFDFVKHGTPVTIIGMIIATVYLLIVHG